ncbi:prestin-like [Mya arenaria]|uniref:prestin-like n=1 Tax=Mya arenaria TaxID=6604 RepID=UPI0022E3AB0E|nr:prestin-like [Mya arenaria]XP_052796673.1 prestin-like [Mya arenaria]XP_052796674.1 prestin-like [Mya arenaria]XP_052796675.1 prestin-like [Mya arenaria]
MDTKMSGCRRTSDFRETFRKGTPETPSLAKTLCTCNKRRLRNMALSVFPVWRIMKKYAWKTDLLADLICGLTVGIMQLPQGMAYAMLAEMPPVVGLYMSFFPVLIYFFFGTSKHISMGTVAVVSLLTGSVVARFYNATSGATANGMGNLTIAGNESLGLFESPSEGIGTGEDGGLPVETKLGIAMSLSLLVGLTQIIMGVLRMGFVTTYMSDPLIAGFTTGTAIHVGTSQVKYIFGLKIPRTDGMFQVIKTYMYIFESIHKTNITTLVTSIICIIILYLVKEHINTRFKDRLKIPVPIELCVVIAGTLASYYGNFHETYGVKVVGYIPKGLPQPSVPNFHGAGSYITDIPIIAIISFAQSVSLAALLAKQHKYTIDSNQELIAYGAGNVVGSFFSCYPFAASVSRSSVQNSAGGKTQVASLFSAFMVLVVILWLGPLFEALPNCVLSAIIVVALRSLIKQLLELPKVWRTSRYDCWIWLVTFTVTTVLHVDYGLLFGLVFSFFTVVLRTQVAKPTRLEKVAEHNLYKDPKYYIKTSSHNTIKAMGYQYPIYYANGDLFTREVYRLASIKPDALRKQIRRASQLSTISRTSSAVSMSDKVQTSHSDLVIPHIKREDSVISLNGQLPIGDPTHIYPVAFEYPLTHIIIDFTTVAFVDSVGCKVLKALIQDYDTVNVSVWMSGIPDDIWNIFEATEIIPKYEENIYLTLDDAIQAAKETLDRRSSTIGVNGALNKVSIM